MFAMKKFCLLLLIAPIAFAEPPPQAGDDEIAAVFAQMDSDRDGQISASEFEKGVRQPYGAARGGVVYQRLPARFRALDTDADGLLSVDEYAGLAPRWQGTGPAPAFEDADRSGDARVDFREFAALHAPRTDPASDDTATR
jgi:Ca2+-binding EF-hand superfamily protein